MIFSEMTTSRDDPAGLDLGTGLRAYGRLLRYPPAAIPFISAVVARLAISMAPLGLLLLVESERDAYGVAGVVTGAFAIGCAIGTPAWGRLMDRFGQVRTLVPTTLASAGLLAADAFATVAGAPLAFLIVLAGFAGVEPAQVLQPGLGPACSLLFGQVALVGDGDAFALQRMCCGDVGVQSGDGAGDLRVVGCAGRGGGRECCSRDRDGFGDRHGVECPAGPGFPRGGRGCVHRRRLRFDGVW